MLFCSDFYSPAGLRHGGVFLDVPVVIFPSSSTTFYYIFQLHYFPKYISFSCNRFIAFLLLLFLLLLVLYGHEGHSPIFVELANEFI